MLFKNTARGDQPASTPTESDPLTKLSLPPSMPAGLGPSTPAASRASDVTETGKRLIVGEGIQLKGEITACDRLVVEGQVEVTLNATRVLEIKPSGHFIGSCEVEEAQISGVYDGDLTVRGRLTVRTGARVTGNIAYGEMELERGGQVAGQLSVREAGNQMSSGRQKPVKRDAA